MVALPSPPSPSPPPPPPPSLSSSPLSSVAGDGHSSAPSLLIIVGIIAFVITASASIHLLLRLISRFRSSSSSSSTTTTSSSSSPPSPVPLLRTLSVGGNDAEPPPAASDRDKLISSLPLFTLASSISAFQKSQSLDCAVCLSNFRPHDELRLLPACRHAFHSQCVDTWLRSTPSCPLCRASIHLPPEAPPPLPAADPSRSGSFRVELGSVSRRRPSVDGIPTGHGRSYSLGSSFEYLVDEEVEAVLERLRRAPSGKPENGIGGVGAPPAPGSEVAEAAGNGGRGWLRECVDRLTSSASSSFNSLRFSGRIGSHHFDPPPAFAVGSVDRSWDLEAGSFVEWEEQSGFGMFYRWLVGV